MAGRCGCSSPSGTSGSPPSSCAGSRSCPRTARASGSSTATTTTPIPGRSSGTGSEAGRRAGAGAAVLLLTGATGLVGRALLRRLTTARVPVRCLVRDPRRLGPERVRVQIALGDLADPPSFRNALRGVDTVVHLAGSARDQPGGSIEELTGIATWRMVQAAERTGVRQFVFLGALGAQAHSSARYLRAKALAERAVMASDLRW